MPKGIPTSGTNKGWFSKTNPAKRTKEQYEKIAKILSKQRTGGKMLDVTKKKISQSLKGKKKVVTNPMWKGDSVKYPALHTWMINNFGQPKECEFCRSNDRKMYHWANKTGRYKRDRNDWLRLCVPCHKKYDSR